MTKEQTSFCFADMTTHGETKIPTYKIEKRKSDQFMRHYFVEYHKKHPEIYQEITRIALALKQSGKKHYSMKAIFEQLRHHFGSIGTETETYKVNNNYARFYAEKIMIEYQDLKGFFSLRS